MKRLLCILVTLALLFTLCGCSKTNIGNYKKVELRFVNSDSDINVVLTDEEAEKIVSILDNNTYHPRFSGVPSCGFTKDVSIKIDSQIYAIACDKCETIQHINRLKFFSVSESDMEYIRSVFEKYGGYFPCV